MRITVLWTERDLDPNLEPIVSQQRVYNLPRFNALVDSLTNDVDVLEVATIENGHIEILYRKGK